MAFVKWVPIIAATLGIFFTVSSVAEKAPDPSFAKDATTAAAEEYYDYIVIGGVTAGCPLAATLRLGKSSSRERWPSVQQLQSIQHTFYPSNVVGPSPKLTRAAVYLNRRRPEPPCPHFGWRHGHQWGFYSRADDRFLQEVGLDQQLVKESYEWVERKLVFRQTVGKGGARKNN